MDKRNRKFDAIVCLSAIDWDFLWQRTQEVMSQFSSMGYPVLFVENTGVRNPGFKDIPRVLNRLKKISSPVQKTRTSCHEGVEVFSPKALPFPYSSLAIRYNTNLIREKILSFSKEKDIPINRILLWTYMTTPLAVELARGLPWAGIVVDMVSDPCKVKGAEAITKSHREILEYADCVLCASVSVMNLVKQQLGEQNVSKVLLFEDGFSTHLLKTSPEENSRLASLENETKKPRVAYIGGINNKIWWDAVCLMASDLPEADFVFAGPKEYGELPCKQPNISWIPPFSEYHRLGSFLKGCKAGLIPYVPTPYVAEMRPAKINEYLVMGLPIIATRLPELEKLDREWGKGIFYLADTPEQFIIALRQALEEDSDELKNKRQEIARERSWPSVCKNLEAVLQGDREEY